MSPRSDLTNPELQLPFQRRFWIAQRVGWAVMVLAVLVALTGLAGGGGPLARTEARGPDGLSAAWDRYARIETTTEWTVTLPPGRPALTLDAALLEALRVERVVPQPRSEEGGRGAVTFRFEDAGPDPLAVTLHLTPQRAGRIAGRLAAEEGGPLPVSLFVYP